MGDKPVLIHTLEVFRRYDEALQIILVPPQEQQSFWKQLCDEHHFTVKHVLAEGGETRFIPLKRIGTGKRYRDWWECMMEYARLYQ